MPEAALLGRTGILVSRICLGAWQASGWESSDEAQFIKTVQIAFDNGINFIDTAESYGNGLSEQLITKALGKKRDKVILASKFSPHHSKPEKIRKALEVTLRRLKTDYIDLYQQHWPPKLPPLDETISELENLRTEGKIRAIGVSNWMEPEWAELTSPSRVDTLQPCYSLLWRTIETNVLPLCQKHAIAVLPYSPLAQGLLALKPQRSKESFADHRKQNILFSSEFLTQCTELFAAISSIALKTHKTPAQVALRWILDQPGITSVVVGASRPEQILENLGSLEWKLDSSDHELLSKLSFSLSNKRAARDTLWNWHSRQ